MTTRYTQQQLSEFKQEFASRRKRQLIATVPMLLVFVLLITANEKTGTVLGGLVSVRTAVPVAFLIIIGLIVFALTNWRCPACHGYLGKAMNPSFCSKCGVALR